MSVKTVKSSKKPAVTTAEAPLEVIYADRIVSVGVGQSVSRLTLATETSELSVIPFAQLVIPTPILFDTIEFLTKYVMENSETNASLIDSLATFKSKLDELGGRK